MKNAVSDLVRLQNLYKLWMACFLTLMASSQVWAWSDVNWPYRSHVLLTNNTASAATGHVFEISLSTADFHPNYSLTADGNDLRIYDSDDITPLSFYIDKWQLSPEFVRVFVTTTIPANSSKTVYIYYGNSSGASPADINAVLTESGLRFHTRPYNADSQPTPSSLAEAESIFDNLSDGNNNYGCTIVEDFVYTAPAGANDIANKYLFGSGNNIFFRAEHWFEVAQNQEWQFQFGGDYGKGGAIYVDDQATATSERWGEDLWWGFNFNSGDTISTGTVTLAAGWHTLKFFGVEGCCDGPTAVRYRSRNPGPGNNWPGGWKDWSIANYAIRSPSCATNNNYPAAVKPPVLQTSTKIGVDVNGNDLLAGELITYTITLIETNAEEAQRVSLSDDMSSLSITAISNVVVPAGASSNVSGTLLTVSNITVPASGSAIIIFDALVDIATAPATVITNTADFNSPGGNDAYAKATLTANDLTVAPTAVVDLAITVDTPTAAPGSIVTYTVTTTNISPSLAYDVLIGSHIGLFTALRLQFDGTEATPFKCISGCPASGLSIPVAGEEYDDGTDAWGYTLSSGAGGAPGGYDAVVKKWRIPMTGDMNSNTSAPDNEVVIQYQLIIL